MTINKPNPLFLATGIFFTDVGREFYIINSATGDVHYCQISTWPDGNPSMPPQPTEETLTWDRKTFDDICKEIKRTIIAIQIHARNNFDYSIKYILDYHDEFIINYANTVHTFLCKFVE